MRNWHLLAKCRGEPPQIFFPEMEKGESGDRYWAKARAICSECPVKAECLSYVLPFEEQTGRRDGFWAGMTPKERDKYAWDRMVLPPRKG